MKISLSSNVWALAWPVMLSNISVPLLGMVDTAIVGHLPSTDNIAAVALGTMVFDVLFWCFGFLRMSTTAITAQEAKSNDIYLQSIIIAVCLALMLIFGSPLLKPAILFFINTEPVVANKLLSYFDIRILAAIPTLINYVNYGFFFGRQNTRAPLGLLLVTNILAMLLDYIFVWHMHMGADGIALANLITQTFSAALGGWLIYTRYLRHALSIKYKNLFTAKRCGLLFTLNSNIFIRTLFLVTTTSFFTRQSAHLGVSIVAANMILMNMQILTSFALDGFAIAAETLVARAVGNKDRQDFYLQIKSCAGWSLIFGLVFMLFYLVLGPFFISLMTSLPEVKSVALQSLAWVIILPLICIPGFLLDGVFIGAACSKPLRNAILFASIIVFFPVWYLSQPLLNQGLWLAYTCFMVARGLYLFIALRARNSFFL